MAATLHHSRRLESRDALWSLLDALWSLLDALWSLLDALWRRLSPYVWWYHAHFPSTMCLERLYAVDYHHAVSILCMLQGEKLTK